MAVRFLGLVICAMVGVASAQPAPAACFPECRAGFVCNRGACVAACNPACAAGELCSPQGTCVSACNPPCGAGETCTADRQCVAQPGGAPPNAVPPGSATIVPDQAADPGWAQGASIFGYISAGVIAALATGVIATNNSDADEVSGIIGGVTVAYTAASIPIVAFGGSSARHHPAVRGVLALRICGWIGYGLTLSDATVLVALILESSSNLTRDQINVMVASVGLLGSATAVLFALDAGISASQAKAIAARGKLTLTPGLGVTRTASRDQVPLLTLSGTF